VALIAICGWNNQEGDKNKLLDLILDGTVCTRWLPLATGISSSNESIKSAELLQIIKSAVDHLNQKIIKDTELDAVKYLVNLCNFIFSDNQRGTISEPKQEYISTVLTTMMGGESKDNLMCEVDGLVIHYLIRTLFFDNNLCPNRLFENIFNNDGQKFMIVLSKYNPSDKAIIEKGKARIEGWTREKINDVKQAATRWLNKHT
jgi:hypothetical protein